MITQSKNSDLQVAITTSVTVLQQCYGESVEGRRSMAAVVTLGRILQVVDSGGKRRQGRGGVEKM